MIRQTCQQVTGPNLSLMGLDGANAGFRVQRCAHEYWWGVTGESAVFGPDHGWFEVQAPALTNRLRTRIAFAHTQTTSNSKSESA